ncbi:TonB family protein [Marinifilum sp.]|uniref:TonB family protein n=1 Tax=Marinifilum sp. TaxID=2033137 RepID=UPI003BACE26E
MNEFLEYFLQSSGILALFYLVYFLFLKDERYFNEIRIYLLSSLVLSLVLPLIKIPYTVIVETVDSAITSEFLVGSFIPESEFADDKQWNYPLFILGAYLMIMLVLFLRSCIKAWEIWIMIKGKDFITEDECRIVFMDKKIPAFSFFGYIVISKEEYEEDSLKNILTHEKVHAKQKHWIDLLLIEVLCIVFWFNPFVWLFQIAIKQTHELLADDGVIARGFGIGQYQAILINQIMGAELVGLANNFNYSINKKRMIMMSKEKGPNYRRYKLLLMIPVVIAVLAFNMKVVEVQAQEVDVKEVQKNDEVKISGVVLAEDGKPIPGATVLVEETRSGTITNIKGEFELQASKDANVMVYFVGVEPKKMTVHDFVLNGIENKNHFLKIKMKTLKQTTNRKDWKPAPAMHKVDGEQIFVIVEKMPEFPGGKLALKKHIKESVVYPKLAKEEGITGRVFVTFIVTKEGKVDKVRVIRGVEPSLNQEAKRVIEALPDWTPGEQRGKKVNVSCTLPVAFGVSDKSTKAKKEYKSSVADGKKYFILVEEMPEFPGGELELKKFITKNIKYPNNAKKKGIEGKVLVSFIVNEEGEIEQIKIARGVDPSIDKEAMRLVRLMPKWKPGKQRGKLVSVAYTLPIEFDLREVKKDE